jgi:hypothetical protein
MRPSLIVIAALALAASAAGAATLHVPMEYPTIQAGVDSASIGDTVLVAAGTYTGTGNRVIHFWGRDITLASEQGPGSTCIDCQGADRAFFFVAEGESRDASVEGFTILNGYALGFGGAAIFRDSSPTFRYCVFSGCYVGPDPNDYGVAFGGAVCARDDAHPLFENCSFIGNEVHGYPGMGTDIAISGGALTLNNCLQGYGTDDGQLHGYWLGVDGGSIDVTTFHCLITVPETTQERGTVPDPGLCDWYPGNQTGFELCADSPALPGNNDWGELVGAMGEGCGPCVTAVECASWGSIKAMYR